jgi:hypothetical protein
MPFVDKVLEHVVGKDTYLFIDGFSRYHQLYIGEEDKKKITFTT